MPEDMDITLWFNKHRLDALYEHGVNIENDLTEFFNSLYNQFVPAEERKKIEEQIKTEQAEDELKAEQSRRFALLTITQDGATACYEYDNCRSPYTAASWFVRALKESTLMISDDGVRSILPSMTDSVRRMETDSRVNFCAELNHDKGYMRLWDDGEWKEYSGDQLTKAVRAASRKAHLKPEQRDDIFIAKLDELTSDSTEPNMDEGESGGMVMQ